MTTEKMTEEAEDAVQKDSPEPAVEGTAEKTTPETDDQMKGKKKKKLSKEEMLKEELEETKIQLAEQKDKFLRLYAEFDNYKRRTARERLEFLKTAGQDVIEELLPVLDDFDRAAKAMQGSDDIEAARSGFELIREKIFKKLEFKGLEPMDAEGKEFDPDFHEAVTEIPAPTEDMKGKVVDVIEKGYTLNQKIIRYAKVVVGK